MKCYICGGTELTQFLSLGHQPPSDAFLREEQLAQPEVAYPLDLLFCHSCTLVQLGYAVDPDLLFREYVYTTGSNSSLRRNFTQLAETIVARYALHESDLVIDIGSNDGTLLSAFRAHGVRILGVDPSTVGGAANDAGIPTINEYFTLELAQRIREEHGAVPIITCTNAFAHVRDLTSFLGGINSLLSDGGVFISESHYLASMIENLQYDSVYHEHLRYYTLRSLAALFKQFELEIVDAERISTHGGSIRVFAARRGFYPVRDSVLSLGQAEDRAGLASLDTYAHFAERVRQHRRDLLSELVSIRQRGDRVMGIGAPAKGNTLLNYCRLDPDFLECLVETSSLKIGLFAPGSHIPVVNESRLFEKQPEYALLLSWNIADELVPKLRANGFKGRFILPVPKVQVL
jgi:2-polyprenyl-3-methyl-5-hydroxy-6-metoxy-1,4-benzoquinol methylase